MTKSNTWLYKNKKKEYRIENPNVFLKRDWQRTMKWNLQVLARFIAEVEHQHEVSDGSLYFDMTQLLFTISSTEKNSKMKRKRPLIYHKGAWDIREEDFHFSNRGIKRKILEPSWIGLRGLLFTLGYILEFDYGKPDNSTGVSVPEGSFRMKYSSEYRVEVKKALYEK